MFRKFSVVAVAVLLTGGALAAGVTSASAADPLTIAKPNPSGVTEYEKIELPAATRNSFYSFQLIANGGVPPYSWVHDDAHSSPWDFGLTISPTGLISGTPPNADETTNYGYIQNFIVTDSAEPPNTASISTRLWVYPYFRITTATLPNGTAGAPYYAALAAKGGATPFAFSAGATMPKGLKLSKTGIISGTPKWGGTFLVPVNVQDGQTTQPRFATKSFLLSVSGPTGPAGSGTPKPVVYGTGDLTCAGGVTIKAAGAGANGSGYVTAQYKGKLSCQGSTGNPYVHPVSAAVQGSIYHSGACSSMSGVQSDVRDFSLVYKTTGGKMYASQVKFTNGDATSGSYHLPAAGGTSSVTGSYAGTGTATAAIAPSGGVSQLQSQCGNGYRKAKLSAIFVVNL